MVVVMTVHGWQTICTVKEFTLGKMEDTTRENISTTKSMALESIPGPMVESISVNGLMESSMGKVNMFSLVELKEKDFGRKGKE